jgi:hypothetical protein
MITANTPISELTVGQLMEVLSGKIPKKESKYMTVDEAIIELKISKAQFYKLLNFGYFSDHGDTYMDGRKRMISVDAIRKYREQRIKESGL